MSIASRGREQTVMCDRVAYSALLSADQIALGRK